MKKLAIEPAGGFRVLAGTGRSQAATMALEPGGSTGGPGTLLLIEAGETHEVRCDSDQPLRTLNIYAPPAY